MKYNFDEIVNRRGTYSIKWDGGELIKQIGLTERYDEETILFLTDDMHFPLPQPLLDFIKKTVYHRFFDYSIFQKEYFKSIKHCLKKNRKITRLSSPPP